MTPGFKRRVSYPKWLSLGLAFVCAAFIGLNLLFPLPLAAARHVSPVVEDQSGRWVAGFTIEQGTWRIPAKLSEIDPRFTERLIAVEDKRFWQHSGVDVPAILRAGRSWKRAGKPVSGASTITMQLVRQIEPRPRTLGAKVIEVFRAVQYEIWLSKSEILELYLTHISYGSNIEGVVAASQVYFGKPPDQLTDGEIALLISLPQAPEARRPDLRPNAAKAGRDIILDKLVASGHLSAKQALESQELGLEVVRHALPEKAWITARKLVRPNARTGSSLDYDLQAEIEDLAGRFAAKMDAPANIAITVIENETMSVRAHIASADRNRPGGWIDMTDRARSPGSTLKPFIYGLAMDDGLLSAGSHVADAPTRFGSYQPENFNRRYYGDVRIYEALRHSLNVPAVAILEQIGGPRFEATLMSAGADLTRLGGKAEKAGLALALGGTGITANDLGVLYAALANGGAARPLNWSAELVAFKPYRFLSAQTAADITRILRQAPTPKGRVPAWLAQNAPPIAYKTGTSYGFRDAWAAGYTDDWTVIVWAGRPDGGARRGETGRLAAAPLLFDVFSRLDHKGDDAVFERDPQAPQGLTRADKNQSRAPQILFPPDGAELLTAKLGQDGRGFTLSARSEGGQANFYVNGKPVKTHNGKPIWRPETSGFYTVRVVDSEGRIAEAQIEVLTTAQLALR